MANELRIGGPAPGSSVYCRIAKMSNSQWWTGTTFQEYVSGNYSNYVVPMTEQGTSGVWVANFPTAITDAGTYEIFCHVSGGSALEGDPIIGTLKWEIGTLSTSSSGAVVGEMSATDWSSYIIRSFKRTDKSLELYDATNEAIAEIRRKIRTSREEKETTTTDTISTLGEYQIDIEPDFSSFVSDVFIRDSSDGFYLTRISKPMFDTLYSKWGTSSSERDLPRHYCVFGQKIYIGPVPDKTSYSYVVSYTKDDHILVSASSLSVPFSSTGYREILKHGTLWRLYKLVENDDQAGAYKALWDDGLDQIDTKERRNRSTTWAMCYRDC